MACPAARGDGEKAGAGAIGQCELMFLYDKFFGEYDHTVAQVLLTADVVDFPRGRENVQNTFRELLSMGVIPVVNENDTVETQELEGKNFGDNDTLSAVVAGLCGAQGLVILTDIDGLYDSDPRKNPQARRIPPGGGNHPCRGGAGRGRGLHPGHRRHGHQAEGRQAGQKPGDPYGGDFPGSHTETLYQLLRGEDVGTVFPV